MRRLQLALLCVLLLVALALPALASNMPGASISPGRGATGAAGPAGGMLSGTYPDPGVVAISAPLLAAGVLPACDATRVGQYRFALVPSSVPGGPPVTAAAYYCYELPGPLYAWVEYGDLLASTAAHFNVDVASIPANALVLATDSGAPADLTFDIRPTAGDPAVTPIAPSKVFRVKNTMAANVLTLNIYDLAGAVERTLRLYPGAMAVAMNRAFLGVESQVLSVTEGLGLDVNDGTPLDGQRNLRISTAANAKTITLPACTADLVGWEFVNVKHVAAGNPLTIQRAGADTIDGAASVVSGVAGTFWSFHCGEAGRWDIR